MKLNPLIIMNATPVSAAPATPPTKSVAPAQLPVRQLMKLPGVKLTGTFNPALVEKRVKTMATNILKAGEAKRWSHGKARALALWAANQVGFELRDTPNSVSAKGICAEDKLAVYELAISYVAAQLLKKQNSNYQQYHHNQMVELKETIESWYTGKTKQSGPQWARGPVTDLSLYQFSDSIKKRIIATTQKPMSEERLKKSQEAIDLLSSDTVVTFDIT